MDVDLLSFENPIFKSYVFWSAVLIIKMLLMAPLTGFHRFRTQTYINKEDLIVYDWLKCIPLINSFANPEDLPSKKLKVKFDEPSVERVRRAHRNDLESILPFFVAAFFYVLTGPNEFIAINLFRAVAVSRILHTFVYAIVPLPQPSRALAFFTCLLATLYMSIIVILKTL
ncbi:microsomal glutathione S-transferase 1 isoform X1 [Condylostylus longicornis]|uniref:microsomal glutathione S-transferase 1 isoform X1 n=1 Tax=Condylostylus longicornis TaxID=2530218 RepID=UPI00244E0DD6|nr:microsomal glutathione S-transferase 1 isoform X1 [Condylostylus longicornis]